MKVEVLDLEADYFGYAESGISHEQSDEFVFLVERLEEEVELLRGEDVWGGFHLGVVWLVMIVGKRLHGELGKDATMAVRAALEYEVKF